jgi:DNA-binding response OmpR family regulator
MTTRPKARALELTDDTDVRKTILVNVDHGDVSTCLAITIAIAKRTGGPHELNVTMRLGDIEIDLLHPHAKVGANGISLSGLELSLLYLLVSNAGEVLTRERILDALWGEGYVPDSNVVDVQIRALRRRLDDDARRPRYIETVPGEGYRFKGGALR